MSESRFRGELWAEADYSQLRRKGGKEAAANVKSYFKNLCCEGEERDKRKMGGGRERRVGGRIFFF